ncbi:hypothetical protein DFH06DRAFT_489633 [Mycena polygramma]|nr:hypothetical protein DFH06DRAFT_489633 [Mycena polygramma]
MIFDPATGIHLKPWLVRTLEPICDAEPGALADYILALLKHNVPEAEMRKELTLQLDEFLEKECPPFIETLFTVLRTKSYLPYGASPSSAFPPGSADTGIPIPLGIHSSSVSPDRTRKRSFDNDERDGRPPAKGPRLSSEGQFSRYSNGRGGGPDRSTGGWGARVERPPVGGGYRDSMSSGAMGVNGGQMNGRRPQPYLPPDQKRGICRDYHNNGYCSRGAYCKFSHGDDAVVPGQLFPMNGAGGMPFMPMFPQGGVPFGMNGGAGPAYDPHEARMDMRPPTNGAVRPQPRAPLIARAQQEGPSRMARSGELPVIQDLTPPVHDAPGSPVIDPQRQPPPHLPLQSPHAQMNNLPPDNYNGYGAGRNGMSGQHMNGTPAIHPSQMDVDMPNPMDMGGPMNHHHSSPGGFRGGRGGPRGKGVFNGEVHKFNPERRNDKTLVVEKIPEDKLSLEHVNDWFKRFGTVTNVAIDSSSAKALVSFSNHEEAHAAWKSEDAVFNNRFVKLFWHRPMEGHGQIGSRMLAASAPVVANIVTKPDPGPATPVAPAPSRPVTSTPARKAPSATSTALAAKQQLLEKQIAEQKALMASLSTASPEEKKEIMARLRKLGEEMAPVAPVAVTVKEDPEKKERERLDKELELHSATVKVEEEESTDDLKAKLERLKAEAASLGLSENGVETSWGGSYRPYRGRGRGSRSYYRGAGAARGGPPRASMKLDNRPKKLIVKGTKEDSTQAVRDWYETTGQLESLTTVDNGDIVVTFRTRSGAEQGLAKGQNISLVGPVQVAWHTGPVVGSTATSASTPHKGDTDIDIGSAPQPVELHSQDAPHSPGGLIQEEEVASGWGDGDEDGMGML